MASKNRAQLRPLVLDASVAINLLATGEPWAILSALGYRALAPEQVLDEVVRCPITRRRYDEVKHPFKISPNVEVVALAGSEVDDFVAIAQSVGDGEAASIAVALARGLPLALDDRRARAVALARAPTARLLWTMDLLYDRALRAAYSEREIEDFIASAIKHARMHAPKAG